MNPASHADSSSLVARGSWLVARGSWLVALAAGRAGELEAEYMKPMYLPDVEQNPQPSPYRSLIEQMQQQGLEYPQIWHLFAFLPSATEHLARFTQEILRGPVAAQPRPARADCGLYVAAEPLPVLNQVARRSCGGIAWRRGAGGCGPERRRIMPVRRPAQGALPLHRRGESRLAEHHARGSRCGGAAGWTDEELYFAITVCALFNFYNRWIDATGVHALSDEAHRQGGKRSAVHGYVRK